MRIYTKTGDDGTTGLFGGARVSKNSDAVEAFGTVDELNAVLGVARSSITEEGVGALLSRIQDDLFCLGAELACVPGHEDRLSSRRLTDEDVGTLEASIDRHEAELPPLKNFILPGGSAGGAALHHARTVCRRAERRITTAAQSRTLRPLLSIYLNRLGDLLFVLARRVNQLDDCPDVLWNAGGR
ncbi:MAG TPA: cob(I)yrinic acid a,c-diamide adenosyltransferase [Polyangiaceae bacterium]